MNLKMWLSTLRSSTLQSRTCTAASLTALVLTCLVPQRTSADVSVVTTNNGCAGYSIVYSTTQELVLGTSSLLQSDIYQAFAGGRQVSVCYLQYQYSMDDLFDAIKGTNKTNNPDPFHWLINDKIRNSLINQHRDPNPPYIWQYKNQTDAGGVRGSVDASGGWALTTASPAFDIVSTDAVNDTNYVAFVVEAAAPGDSLSIYGPTGVIWSHPISEFNVGQLNFATIPAQGTDPLAPITLGFWVHNAGQGSSTVWFPGSLVFSPDPAQSIIRVPADHSAFPQNSSAGSSFACTDNTGITLANCIGSSANGTILDTAVVGPQSYTVTATDSAGNVATSTSAFTISPFNYSTAGTIWTLAGNGRPEYFGDGGPAIAAGLTLSSPSQIAVDSARNVYFADTANHRVRKIVAATGTVATVAGNGAAAFAGDGAAATAASLNTPTGIALDSAGNLFIADTANHRIRRVDALSGIVTTFAGNGSNVYAGDGAVALASGLQYPTGLAIDASGNIFIADAGSNSIRRVESASGVISTVAGTGTPGYSGDGTTASAAQLKYPTGVAFDSSGSLFIADYGNNRVRKVDAVSGLISTVAGNGTGGAAAEGVLGAGSPLDGPASVAVDPAGNIYVADTNNNAIHRIDATTGILSSIVGAAMNGVPSAGGFSGDGAAAAAATVAGPTGIALDSQGTLYIVDSDNERIRFVPGPGTAPTPPIVKSSLSGTQGLDGWYIGPVTISWDVADPASAITSKTGCDPVTLSADTVGQILTCSATSAGGTTTRSVTVKIDKTLPTASGTLSPLPNANGWNHSNVLAHFTGADATSLIASCSADQTVAAEGVNQSVTGSCSDNAGNVSAPATLAGINIDETPPAVTGSRTPAPNGAGWNNTAVTVSFSATDALSGVNPADCTSPIAVSGDGAGQSATGSCLDKAGNSGSAVVSGINIDRTPPTATASALPAPNAAGWNNSNLTVSFAGTDSLSGSGGVTCTPATIVSLETAGQLVSGTCSDLAGNLSLTASKTIRLDKTPPSASVTTPSNGASYVRGTQVLASYSCSDALSGVAQCAGTVPVNTAIDTASAGPKTFTVTPTDIAGNPGAPVSVTYTVTSSSTSDTTPPVIVPQIAGTAGTNGWYRSNVTLTWSVSDPDSAIKSSTGCRAASITTDTSGKTFTCSATSAGGIATVTVTIKRDASSPSVTIKVPSGEPGDAVYRLRQVVNALYACADSPSGIVSCAGPVPSGSALDTSSVGTKLFAVTATDNAGNTRTVSRIYRVR